MEKKGIKEIYSEVSFNASPSNVEQKVALLTHSLFLSRYPKIYFYSLEESSALEPI